MYPRYITNIDQVSTLSKEEREVLLPVTKWFPFRSNEYYLSLINWDDEEDPLRRLIIPHPGELNEWGDLDPSSEETYTCVPGLQHKYPETALLLVSNGCGGHCRFCFRKRLFVEDDAEVACDVSAGIEYVRDHPEITNILLSGGDPLILETERLESIMEQIRSIDHIRIIRIGSKMPAYNPYRIVNDPTLLRMIRRYSLPDRRIYLMTQFNHTRELTPVAREALRLIMEAGAVIMNQSPLIRGVNDEPAQLASLFKELSFLGVAPYYVFQCRPVTGNRMFSMPLEEAFEIFETARLRCSGLAKRARFVMSHASGKIEVVGKTDRHTFFKYNQAASPENRGKFLVFRSNPDAYWFDDYAGLRVDSGIHSSSNI